MAETTPLVLEQELSDIRKILWGDDIKPDIFKRWSQGFYFSTSEPTALEQSEGGPCAIIAPVQAFILKNLLLKYKDLSFREKVVSTDGQNLLLVNSLSEILEQCNNHKYYIVYLNNSDLNDVSDGLIHDNLENGIITESESTTFHESLRLHTFQVLEEVRKYYLDNIQLLKSQFGVLLFLYSVIMTRGLARVQSDSSNDLSEPLIDDTYGYGSQSLINLIITGRATTYVWDHEQDVGGLSKSETKIKSFLPAGRKPMFLPFLLVKTDKLRPRGRIQTNSAHIHTEMRFLDRFLPELKGLEKQSQIGFITTMEHLRYCTVGSFYKNPIHPVWVLGSDTHLTVLFSTERRLVSPETKTDQAKRVFRHFDPDGNNFISSSLLQDVLQALDLVSEEAYVDIMRKRLDPENLGIILLNNFMDEFFPKEDNPMPDVFSLVHYNGLAQSNLDGQIRYRIGECVLLESDLRAVSESNPMLTILQTKWPNIEIRWNELGTPSLN